MLERIPQLSSSSLESDITNAPSYLEQVELFTAQASVQAEARKRAGITAIALAALPENAISELTPTSVSLETLANGGTTTTEHVYLDIKYLEKGDVPQDKKLSILAGTRDCMGTEIGKVMPEGEFTTEQADLLFSQVDYLLLLKKHGVLPHYDPATGEIKAPHGTIRRQMLDFDG